MKVIRKNSGFTLLEIIIVIIIIGILASLALPRIFDTIGFSEAAEAFNNLGVIRKSVERCSLMRSNVYTDCDNFTNIDIGDPGTEAGTHFTDYTISITNAAGNYNIKADRDGGGTHTVTLTVVNVGGSKSVTRAGTGDFDSIQ